ncbi:hypothetical protein GY21_17225 [Cryobacterium roopkundense]|uniref:Activator of Hsp90 ATPase homologue 1/2-like C-terminal domain-containing protein n=1 Tax=Cryobacterium roopkundense TaxID=1001240 RepID=A0A099J1R1_9MICO|nr:SRPBCC domain-containing protein [Cryobacterium roopkundense]KGJ72151.1 hypothetical protein GY21_17225 [Cryobacterium roopkundense]MBB5642243.1 hypothetical protein [Cryobacterium roopkundense]
MDIQKISTTREVIEAPAGGETGIQVRLGHVYQASVADVWRAVTEPESLERWFLPLSGDLHVGGAFQFEGNAGGTILACEPEALLRVTFGMDTSVVEVRLRAVAPDSTEFTFEHTVPLSMAGSGAGALYVAPAWDMSVVGLGLFLRGEFVNDPSTWENSPAVQRYARQAIDAWAAAIELSELASATELAEGVAASIAQFAPDAP